MNITLDDLPLEATVKPGCTLQYLIDYVRGEHAHERLIVAISINGRRLNPDELTDALQQTVGPADQVELETGVPALLARQALGELAVAFDEAGRAQIEVADQLSGGESSPALRTVSDYVMLWQTCQSAIVQCSGLLATDLTQHDYRGRPLVNWLNDAGGVLNQIRSALEARDMVALSDVVRYELPALSDTWRDICDHLAASVPDAA